MKASVKPEPPKPRARSADIQYQPKAPLPQDDNASQYEHTTHTSITELVP